MKSTQNWNEDDAKAFVQSCLIWIGPSFHPDTEMKDYVVLGTNQEVPTFTVGDAMDNQEKLDKAFELLGDDIYEIGMELGYKLGYYPRPDNQRDPAADELARAAKALIEAKLLRDGYNNRRTPEYNGARERLLNALTDYYKVHGTPDDLMRQGKATK